VAGVNIGAATTIDHAIREDEITRVVNPAAKMGKVRRCY
jgi:hypothetical protein